MTSEDIDPKAGAGLWVVFAHILAGLLALAGGITILVFVLRMAADGIEPWASWREATRIDGFSVLVLAGAWILLGALLHSPIALARRGSQSAGWTATAVLILFFLVMVAAAVALLQITPSWDDPAYGRRDPGPRWYTFFLATILLVPAAFALSGLLFLPPHKTVPGWRLWFTEFHLVFAIPMAVSLIGALICLVALVFEWFGISFVFMWLLLTTLGPPLYKLAAKVRERWKRHQEQRTPAAPADN